MNIVAPIVASNKHGFLHDHNPHETLRESHDPKMVPSMRKSSIKSINADKCTNGIKNSQKRRVLLRKESSESCSYSNSNTSGSDSRPKVIVGRSSSNEAIRSRFLNRLGIPTPGNANKSVKQNNQERLLKDTNATFEPLKYKSEEAYRHLSARPASATIRRTSLGQLQSSIPLQPSLVAIPERKNKIAFSSTVSVVPIPKHQDYSKRVKTRLWANRNEIQNNAQRNYIEFAAEGWDWRSVTEEKNMFLCTASGQLIHPVHCRPFYHLYNNKQKTQYPQTSIKKEVTYSSSFQTNYSSSIPKNNYY